MTGDWRFARRPFWLFSHLFAATVVASFVALGFWQLDRLDQRQAANALIEARAAEREVIDSGTITTGVEPDELEYRRVVADVRIVEPDFARVVNRTQNGLAGEHVVAIAEFDDGTLLALNRGFVPLGAPAGLDPVPDGSVSVDGWLRATVERGGLGAIDQGEGTVLPRFDTERLGVRLGRSLAPVWLQVATIDGVGAGPTRLPEPVPLPPIDDGPHLGYAVQWFIFAALGLVFYGTLLGRRARGHRSTVTVAAPSPPVEVSAPSGNARS